VAQRLLAAEHELRDLREQMQRLLIASATATAAANAAAASVYEAEENRVGMIAILAWEAEEARLNKGKLHKSFTAERQIAQQAAQQAAQAEQDDLHTPVSAERPATSRGLHAIVAALLQPAAALAPAAAAVPDIETGHGAGTFP
jgi:hypothetical protein